MECLAISSFPYRDEETIMETEIKLLFDSKYRSALLRHPLLAPSAASEKREQVLSDTYFDTPDFRLHDSNVGLRVRRVNGGWIQNMKAGTGAVGGLHHRSEWETPVDSSAPELLRLRDLVDDAKIKHKFLAGAALRKRIVPIFTTNVKRTVWEIQFADGTHIECALDGGKVEAGARKATISEIELELKSGSASHLFDLALTLLKDIPLHVGNRSKADRGFALTAPTSLVAVKATALELSKDMSVELAFIAIITNCLKHMQGNEDGVCAGDDVESVHQMRVGLRRLRSALIMFKTWIGLPAAMERELDWLAAELGDARDWDVLVGTTLPAVEKVVANRAEIKEVKEAAARRADEHHMSAAAAVGSPRYTALMLNMARWLQTKGWRLEPTQVEKQLAQPVLKFARKILRKDQHRLRTRAGNLRGATPEVRHRVRIAAKKTRYAAEFFESLFSAKIVRQYVKGLTGLQDELGFLNDAAVAARLLTHIAAAEPKLQENAGFIKGVLAARAERENSKIIKIWKRFERVSIPSYCER